jgi:hypothetical protein
LSAAIIEFNAAHKSILNIPQPPLTEDEVVAAIRYWKAKRNDAPVTNRDFAYFQKIADHLQLPADAQFETQFADEADGSELTAWSVRIRLPKGGMAGGTYAFVIREQYIRWRSGKAKEAKIEWGPASPDGLQAGLRLRPNRKSYVGGQLVTPTICFRNTGKEQMSTHLPRNITHRFYVRILAEDDAGAPILVDPNKDAGSSKDWEEVTLHADDVHEIDGSPIFLGEGEFGSADLAIRAKPGTKVHLRFVLTNPIPITTGDVVFKMLAPPSPGQTLAPDERVESRSRTPMPPAAAGGAPVSGKAKKEAKIEWGPVSPDGLQAGLFFTPQSQWYLDGQLGTPTFYYRNTGKQPLDISYPHLMTRGYYRKIVATDAAGKVIRTYEADLLAPVGWTKTSLQPGAIQEVRGMPVGLGEPERGWDKAAARAVSVGSVRLQFVLPNPKKDDGKPLETGIVVFSINMPASPEPEEVFEGTVEREKVAEPDRARR